MSRFDVYRTGNGEYFLDVQTDLPPSLGTRLVVPLMPAIAAPRALSRLHPVLEVDGISRVMATHLLGAIPQRELGAPVANLKSRYDDIIAALDMIFLGF